MASPVKRALYMGTFIHSKSLAEMEYLHDSIVAVDENGKIAAIKSGKTGKDALLAELGWIEEDVDIKACGKEQFFFPGFIGMIALSSNKYS
jgi:guanine deaminase